LDEPNQATHHQLRSFPYLCKHLPDEIFSSWFFRLAKGNSCDPYTFAHHLINKGSLFGQDCDLQLPDRWILTLQKKLNISDDIIRSSLLTSLIGNYVEDVSINGHDREILSGGTRGLFRRHNAQQFCPLCLQVDDQPYYRKQWRLTAMTICTKHLIVLSDQCRHCGASINCHRLTWFHRNSACCFRCGKSLYNQLEITLDAKFPIVNFQKNLEEAMQTGWYVLSNGEIIRTPLLLEGLRFLSRPWFSKKKSESLHQAFRDFTGLPFSTFQPNLFWPVRINRLNVKSRFNLYFVLAWLMEDWPRNLIGFCKHYGITLTAFYKTDAKPPYWIHKVFNSFLNKKVYWTTIDEINSAARYLTSENCLISPGNIAEVLGLDRSLHLTEERKSLIQKLSVTQKQNCSEPSRVFNWSKQDARWGR